MTTLAGWTHRHMANYGANRLHGARTVSSAVPSKPTARDDMPDADDLYLSVTTAIGMLDKPGLLYWAAQESARAAVDEHSKWHYILEEEGRDEAIKWLAKARFRKGGHDLGAAQLGTAVHAAAESLVRDRRRPTGLHAEVVPFIDQFEEWLQIAQPTFVDTEMTVYNSAKHYAGQTDGILELDGQRWLFDYKSTRRTHNSHGQRTMPYQEVALQMSAYENADRKSVV